MDPSPQFEKPTVPPAFVATPPRPTPLSLQSSAMRVTDTRIKNSVRHSALEQDWQTDAWAMYDLVGELRFLTNTLSGRMGQANLYVGVLGEDPTAHPEPTEDPVIAGMLTTLGGGAAGMAQLIVRMSINLLVAGEIWLCGIPPELMPEDPSRPVTQPDEEAFIGVDLSRLVWRALSKDEVVMKGADRLDLYLPEGRIETEAESVFLFRLWRAHPRAAWEADSPTRASLPVLRELVGLTMHISSQVDSRLAGAGILLVPSSADRAMRNRLNIPDDSAADPFTDALMQAMLTPIGDRASASAVVPLVVTAPDDSIEKFQHMSFDRPLDSEARPLREEAIRRLALGQDAPPELLLGIGSLNHWGAWLVREDVVTTHLEPTLALMCDAFTTQYLRPYMEAMNYSPEEIARHVVWYDVEQLIVRPNRTGDAENLYKLGLIKAAPLRNSAGFDEVDATQVSLMSEVDRTVFEMVKADHALITTPGLQALRDQLSALIAGSPIPPLSGEPTPSPEEPAPEEAPPPADAPPPDGTETAPSENTGPPNTQDDPAEPTQ